MKQSKDFFWPSYVDLMTALFLTMLVLFVLSYKLFRDKRASLEQANAKLEVQLKEKKKLDEIKLALKKLESRYFKYNPKYKRYELNFPVQFAGWSYALPPDSEGPLLNAGQFLARQMQGLDENVQYLVVVEGRAAKEPRLPDSDPVNRDSDAVRQLSYNRAMAVLRLWQVSGITRPKNVELIAAGSGQRGLGRYVGLSEGLNRRFIIQVQPKIGSIASDAAVSQ